MISIYIQHCLIHFHYQYVDGSCINMWMEGVYILKKNTGRNFTYWNLSVDDNK